VPGQQGLALPARLEQQLDGRRLFLGYTLRLALPGPRPVLQHGGGRIGGHGAVLAGVLRLLAFEQVAFQVGSESPRIGFYTAEFTGNLFFVHDVVLVGVCIVF
jgi:hypothetical protein